MDQPDEGATKPAASNRQRELNVQRASADDDVSLLQGISIELPSLASIHKK
jgi:hypothetical protein